MMDIDEVRALVARKESGLVEFKKTTGQLERGMETLCAFLNGAGGTVLFGVTDKGDIIGQDVEDSTKRNIAEHIGALEPVATIVTSYVSVPNTDRQVVVLHVEESKMDRPFMYKGRAYMRVESTTVTMPQTTYNNMLYERDGMSHRWESLVNPNLSIDDLNENEILKTVRLGIEYGRLPENTGNNIPDILNRLKLTDNGQLKHAAAILFAKEEMSDYFQCLARLARFRGTNKNVFIDNQQVRGNIFVLLDAAMAFIFKHLSLSGVIEGLEREEHLSVPYKAIREAVVNALCHREYRVAGASVGIAIYDDRVEIENPGSFPHGWNMDNVKSEQRSAPQNPLIANVLYRRKTVETWGRGIGLMVDECVKQGLPEPEFKETGGFVVVTFHYQNESLQRLADRPSTPQVPPKYPPSNTFGSGCRKARKNYCRNDGDYGA